MGPTRQQYWTDIFGHEGRWWRWIGGEWTVLSVILTGIAQHWGPLGSLSTKTLGEIAAFFDLKVVIIGILAIALAGFMESSYRYHHRRPELPLTKEPEMSNEEFRIYQSLEAAFVQLPWSHKVALKKILYQHSGWISSDIQRELADANGFRDPQKIVGQLEGHGFITINTLTGVVLCNPERVKYLARWFQTPLC
jgi:hypothetical protein